MRPISPRTRTSLCKSIHCALKRDFFGKMLEPQMYSVFLQLFPLHNRNLFGSGTPTPVDLEPHKEDILGLVPLRRVHLGLIPLRRHL